MIERKVDKLGSEVSRASLFLSRNFSSAITVERSLEKKSLDLKRKIVAARGRTLRTIGSRDKDSGISGGIGGALGLLGLGFTRKLFRPRVPKTPGALLRMQRGANVSRASQLGRVGRLAKPLAIVGTGLDFIGRKAEGQTNVQAGVGAAGGLAGSLAGAKYGAILGTTVGGPIGTAIGGVGGAIIGGLAGGRIADLFTGANRRRQFEEERAVVRTQRTLFADSLDDFDRVLDKLEGAAPALVLKRDDDDGLPERRFPFGSFFPKPKPKTPFFQQPLVKNIGYTALASGLLALTVLAVGSSPSTPEDYALIASLKATVAKSPFLMKVAKFLRFAPTKKPVETLIPGKDIPGISKKGLEIRGDKILRDLGTFVKKKTPKVTKGRTIIKNKKTLRNQDKVTFSDKKDLELLRKLSQEANKKQIKLIKKYNINREKNINIKKKKINNKAIRDLIKKNIEEGNVSPDSPLKKLFNKNIKKTDNIDISSNLEPPNSTDIALAPTNNIFLINQSEGDSIEVVSDDTPATMTTNGITPYSAAAKYAEFTASLTA